MKNANLIPSVILACGLAALGLFINCGFSTFAGKDRSVSVRGLAEREVKADRVYWPIVYKTTGNDLQLIYDDIKQKNESIKAYLLKNGVPADDISVGAPKVEDRLANMYYSDNNGKKDRYYVTATITVASGKVDLVRSLTTRIGELLRQGIAIAAGDYENMVQYEFNGLNEIKPAMIEEATKNAREAADKFSADSGSQLGKIKNATQGLFTIEDRDQFTPYVKRVRVVTTVDYFLDN